MVVDDKEEASRVASAALSVYRDVMITEALKENQSLREQNNTMAPFRDLLCSLKVYASSELLAQANVEDGYWDKNYRIVPLPDCRPLPFAELWTIYVKRAFHVPYRRHNFHWRAKVLVYEGVVRARIFLGPGVFIYFQIEGYDGTLEDIKTYVKTLACLKELHKQGRPDYGAITRHSPFRNAVAKTSHIFFDELAAKAAHTGKANNISPVPHSETLELLKNVYRSHVATQLAAEANKQFKQANLSLLEAQKVCRTISIHYPDGYMYFDLTKGFTVSRNRHRLRWCVYSNEEAPSIPVRELPSVAITVGNVFCGRLLYGSPHRISPRVFRLPLAHMENSIDLILAVNGDILDTRPEFQMRTLENRLWSLLHPTRDFQFENTGLEGATATILSVSLVLEQNPSVKHLLDLFGVGTDLEDHS